MDPIVLNEFGDTLILQRDDLVLVAVGSGEDMCHGAILGTHAVCGGAIQLKKSSSVYNAVYCKQCGLRIAVPKEVDSRSKLRCWCAASISCPGLHPLVRRRVFLDVEQRKTEGKVTSPDVVTASDEERRRIRGIMGDQ